MPDEFETAVDRAVGAEQNRETAEQLADHRQDRAVERMNADLAPPNPISPQYLLLATTLIKNTLSAGAEWLKLLDVDAGNTVLEATPALSPDFGNLLAEAMLGRWQSALAASAVLSMILAKFSQKKVAKLLAAGRQATADGRPSTQEPPTSTSEDRPTSLSSVAS